MKMNTIRGRILFGYLLLTGAILTLMGLSYWLLQQHRNISDAQQQVNTVYTHYLELAQECQNVLHIDIRTPSFHQADDSEHLKSISASFDRLSISMMALEESPIPEFRHFHEKFIKLDTLIADYHDLYQNLVQLHHERGFIDTGLEGLMRESILELESSPQYLSLSEILQLRRLEKDYFLRLENSYVKELLSLVDSFLLRIPPQHREAQLLKAYAKHFYKITELEYDIGNEKRGFVKALFNTQKEVGDQLTQAQEEMEATAAILIRNLFINLGLAVLVCILITGFSILFLPPLIVRPLKRLSNSMQDIIANDFKEESAPTNDKGIKEIDELSSAYQTLLTQIRNQFEHVNHQNNELRHLNEKLTISEAKARELARIKDKFFSILSHDLRGPMSTALMFLSALKEDPESMSKQRMEKFFTKLSENFTNLNNLMVNLLNWARSQMQAIHVNEDRVNLAEVAQRNIALFSEQIEEKDLSCEVQFLQPAFSLADQNMVDFVIRNLLSNAIKFTPEKGKIKIQFEQGSQKTVVKISDSGVGMSDDQIQRLFVSEEHLSTKGTANEIGTGLGLSLCREFIEQNNGELLVSSIKDQGTTFCIHLPAAA